MKEEARKKMVMMKKAGVGKKTISGMDSKEDKKMIAMMLRSKKGAK